MSCVVLVAGASGFIGSQLVRDLKEQGRAVRRCARAVFLLWVGSVISDRPGEAAVCPGHDSQHQMSLVNGFVR